MANGSATLHVRHSGIEELVDGAMCLVDCGVGVGVPGRIRIRDRDAPDARFHLVRANLALPMLEAGAPVTTAPDKPAGPK